MKVTKRVLGIFIGIILCITLNGCSSISKAEKSFEKYKEFWVKKDFNNMYIMLSSETKKNISEEDFIRRYNNIYSAIGAGQTHEINLV